MQTKSSQTCHGCIYFERISLLSKYNQMADAMRSESNLVRADIFDVTSFEIRVLAALDGLHFWLKWMRFKSKERIDIAAHVKMWQRQTSRVRASSAVLFRPHRCRQCGSTACRSLNIFWASEGVRPTYTVSVVPAMLLLLQQCCRCTD